MTGKPERWDDVFNEGPHDVPAAQDGGGAPAGTMTTPFAQPPQSYDSTRGIHREASSTEVPGFLPPPSPPQQAAPATGQQNNQLQADGATAKHPKFFTFEFFQQFFDVDTTLVLKRMTNAVIPISSPDFLIDRDWLNDASTQPAAGFSEGVAPVRKPDLYGPFWISTTLWMTLAIVSNIMSRIAFNNRKHADGEKWRYDFKLASVACTVIYFYCFGLGCVVWGVMKYKVLPISLVDTLCLYGYSLFIFFPVIFLCTIPVSGFQWIFVLFGGVWSAVYLLRNLMPIWMKTLNSGWSIGMLVVVSAFHTLLTLSFKFYFFDYEV